MGLLTYLTAEISKLYNYLFNYCFYEVQLFDKFTSQYLVTPIDNLNMAPSRLHIAMVITFIMSSNPLQDRPISFI
jgi:hypothetical protein